MEINKKFIKKSIKESGMLVTEAANIILPEYLNSLQAFSNLLNRRVTRIDIEVIGKICKLLNCQPNDIFISK